MRDPDKETIAGFAKGLAVIEAFASRQEKLTISEVAAITGLERATARRCLLTLVRGGYADFDGKFFRLTPRILRLGHAYLSAAPLPRIVQPFLEQLSLETGESASVAILDGTEIVYVARSSQKRVMSIALNVGSRLPAYCSSMGRVLLGGLAERETRRVLEATKREALTPHTVTDIEALVGAVTRCAVDGYSLIDEELELGLRAIAVPLFDARGRVVAALNIGTQAARVDVDRMRSDFLPRLRAIQSEIRPLLG